MTDDEEIEKRWRWFVNTSVDDCRSSLRHCTKESLPVLEAALKANERLGHKTKAQLVRARIKQLEKSK